MAKVIPIHNQSLSSFIEDIKAQGKIHAYLKKKFSVSEDDINDAFYGALKDMIDSDRKGTFPTITCSFTTFFTKACINQTLNIIRKKNKTQPLFDERCISNKDVVRNDKIDELYGFCMNTEEEDRQVRMAMVVKNILDSMSETCRNIIKSFYWDDFSMSTIADMFGFANADSVKAQKAKCMNKIREKYTDLKRKIYG